MAVLGSAMSARTSTAGIRSGAAKPWMTCTGEQVNTFSPEPSRFFLLRATLFGLPIAALHVFHREAATMRVRVCSIVRVVNAAGPEMDRGETVTMFNDLCLLAPAALIDAPIVWQNIDECRVQGAYTYGDNTVTAELLFNNAHELVDFSSNDRSRGVVHQRWSTPVHDYQKIRSRRIVHCAEARWHAPQPEGEFAYFELDLDDIGYNVAGAQHVSRPPGHQQQLQVERDSGVQPTPPDEVVRPSGQRLAGQVSDVIRDLPALLTAPLYRRRHLGWGATAQEQHADLPGDKLFPRAQYRSTRAITIHAPPELIWPWLVQVGCGRAGFYSHDLLDNLARPSATTILPAFQHLEVGQWVPMSPSGAPTEQTALRVRSFEVDRWLLWTKPDSSWVWQLTPDEHGTTRLITRIHAVYEWKAHPVVALFGCVLMEFGDFAMLRAMLLGIKQRAEAAGPVPRSLEART